MRKPCYVTELCIERIKKSGELCSFGTWYCDTRRNVGRSCSNCPSLKGCEKLQSLLRLLTEVLNLYPQSDEEVIIASEAFGLMLEELLRSE